MRELFAFYEAVAEEKSIKLILEGTATMQGNRLMLQRALSNLLSNAIRHSPKNVEVKITIQRSDSGGISLVIKNEGETIETVLTMILLGKESIF